jgi:hypothetical protein
VNVADVNMDLHTRINCAVGPLIIAFDGTHCIVALGNYINSSDAYDVLHDELDKTITSKFAVVKRYCRCEG